MAVEQAKAEFLRTKDRMTKALKATPEDKLLWSPAPSARNPIQLVAHAAFGTAGLGGLIKGEPMQFASTAELDAHLRAMEASVTTAEQALALLETTSADYVAYLDTITDDQAAEIVKLPFGAMPLGVAITMPASHMSGHISQLDYLQTIWGDYDWRMS